MSTRSTRPRVLFVDRDGSAPQIAASLLRRLVGDRVEIDTATTHPTDPGGRSDEMLVAMGLDPAPEQRLTARALYAADRVVMLGRELDVARLSGPTYVEWDVTRGDLVDQVQSLGDDLIAVPAEKPRLTPLMLLGRLRDALRRH